MKLARLLESWPGSLGLALLVHVLAAGIPIVIEPPEAELETVEFELAELPPMPEELPEPEPEPEPEPVSEPELEPPPPPPPPPPPDEVFHDMVAGERDPDPEAVEGVTSLVSSREDDATADAEVPMVTGLALEADQLHEGGMGVRVGNTRTAGFDADVAPEDVRGFTGGGAGGGGASGSAQGFTEEPKVIKSHKPSYPRDMVRGEVEGTVRLAVQVLPSGRVGEVRVLRSVHPQLDAAAVAAARRFRYRPARRAGEKVAAWQVLDFTFRLE